MSRISRLLLVIVGIVSTERTAASQIIEGLGFSSSNVYMSDNGSTLVATLGGPENGFVLWKQGQDLRYIFENAEAFGISGDGLVVVGSMDGLGFSWTDEGGFRQLRGEWGFGTGASYDGSVIVGYGCTENWTSNPDNSPDECGALIWVGNEAPVRMWYTPGIANRGAAWTDSTGSVAAGSRHAGISSEYAHYYAWPSGNTAFTDSPGGTIFGLSSDGMVATGIAAGLAANFAHRWEIGSEPEPIGSFFPRSISGDGSVIVGDAAGLAYVWTRDDGTRPMTDLLTENDVEPGNWQLSAALDVSVDGRTFLGVGYSGGTAQVWRVQLCDQSDWADEISGEFLSSEYWQNEVVPDSTMRARIRGDGTRTIEFPDDVTTGSLNVSGGGDVSFNLQERTYRLTGSCGKALVVDGSRLTLAAAPGVGKGSASGGTLRSEGDSEVRGSGAPQIFVGAGQSVVQAGGLMKVGSEGGAEAKVEVVDGGTGTCDGVCAFGMLSDTKGRLTVKGEGSTWTDGQLWIGVDGEGALDVSDDAVVRPVDVSAASGDGSRGAVTVTERGLLIAEESFDLAAGESSEVTMTIDGEAGAGVINGDMRLGVRGTATVTVRDWGIVRSLQGGENTLTLAVDAGSTAELTVEDVASKVSDFATVVVGKDGDGRLNLKSSATLRDVDLVVLGQGSGSGSILIETEAALTAKRLDLAAGASSSATVVVGGTGAGAGTGSIDVSEETRIGIEGNGSVVLNGGRFDSGLTFLAGAAGSAGSLIFTNGATANLGALVEVGRTGSGALTLNMAASASAAVMWVPASSGSGAVTVQGEETVLQVQSLLLGETGNGTLQADGGGLIRVGLLSVFQNGTFGGNVRATTLTLGLQSPNKAGATEGIAVDSLMVYGEGVLANVESIIFAEGGVLGGTGPFSFPIVNAGTIAPEGADGDIGTFHATASYTQTSGGRLDIDVEGTGDGDYDRLQVDGAAVLGGVVRVNIAPSFAPQIGDRFDIVSASSITGTFETIDALPYNVVVTYTQTTATAEIVSGVAVEDLVEDREVPTAFALAQNYPNPFNPVTTFTYAVPELQHVTIDVFDLLGKHVANIVSRQVPTGEYSVRYDASALPSGTYVYRMTAGSFTQTRQFTLLR